LNEAAQIKKPFRAMTWDLTGTKIVTGAQDGFLRVRMRSHKDSCSLATVKAL